MLLPANYIETLLSEQPETEMDEDTLAFTRKVMSETNQRIWQSLTPEQKARIRNGDPAPALSKNAQSIINASLKKFPGF